MGNKSVRSLLVHAATLYILHSSPNCALRNWALQIETRRGRRPSRVALARKLAVVMLAMWKSGDHFRPRELLRPADGGEDEASLACRSSLDGQLCKASEPI